MQKPKSDIPKQMPHVLHALELEVRELRDLHGKMGVQIERLRVALAAQRREAERGDAHD